MKVNMGQQWYKIFYSIVVFFKHFRRWDINNQVGGLLVNQLPDGYFDLSIYNNDNNSLLFSSFAFCFQVIHSTNGLKKHYQIFILPRKIRHSFVNWIAIGLFNLMLMTQALIIIQCHTLKTPIYEKNWSSL